MLIRRGCGAADPGIALTVAIEPMITHGRLLERAARLGWTTSRIGLMPLAAEEGEATINCDASGICTLNGSGAVPPDAWQRHARRAQPRLRVRFSF